MSETETEFTFNSTFDVIDKISILILIAIMTIAKVYETITNKTYNTNVMKMKEQKMLNNIPIVIEDKSHNTLNNGMTTK